jgi:hypothetical protein
MTDKTVVTPDGRLRVLARPDNALDASGGTQEVTAVELFDDILNERLSFGNLTREDLQPVRILARNAVLFVDPQGAHWLWCTDDFSRQPVADVEATIAAYRPITLIAPEGETTLDPYAAEIRQSTGGHGTARTITVPFANIASVQVEPSVYQGAAWYSVHAIGARCLRLDIGSNDGEAMQRLAQSCATLIGCRLERAADAAGSAAAPVVTQTLSAIWTDCTGCGGGRKFTGRVSLAPDAGRRVEALSACFRCDDEAHHWTPEIAPILTSFAAEYTALSDPRAFDSAWKVIQGGTAQQRYTLLRAQDALLPLVRATDFRLKGDQLVVWAGMMLKSNAWRPRPAMACRVAEVLVAAIDGHEPRCVELVMEAKSRISRQDLDAALAAVEKHCGKPVVNAPNGLRARLN